MATWADRQKAPSKGQQDYAPDDSGLKLRVFASGRRAWYVRGRIKRTDGEGEPRFIVLGEGLTREQADVEAAKARDMLRRGVDPNAEREATLRAAEATRKTFAEVADEWTAANKADWRPATIQVRRHLLKGPRLAPIRDKRIGEITSADLKKVAASVKPNSMQSTLGPVRSVLLYAVAEGYIAKSPFNGIEIKTSEGDAAPLVDFQEGRAPNFAELVAVMDAIDAAEKLWPLSPWWNIWRACIFTGQRPSAVIGMRRDELKLSGDAPAWNLPAERSKIKRASAIPLSKDCAALLREIPNRGALVWPGRGGDKPLSYPQMEPQVITMALSERGFTKGWTAGRARDSVASWLEFQSDATERAMALILGHKPPADNTRRKHYARVGAEHQARVLIERWAQAVRDARAGKAARVVPMRRAK